MLTEPARVSDLILWEVDQRYTRISARFENDTGADAEFGVGTVLEDDTTHYQPADSTTFGAILLKDLGEVANGTGVDDVPMLVRGPVLVNADALVWDAGATQASVLAAMATAGVRTVSEADNINEA